MLKLFVCVMFTILSASTFGEGENQEAPEVAQLGKNYITWLKNNFAILSEYEPKIEITQNNVAKLNTNSLDKFISIYQKSGLFDKSIELHILNYYKKLESDIENHNKTNNDNSDYYYDSQVLNCYQEEISWYSKTNLGETLKNISYKIIEVKNHEIHVEFYHSNNSLIDFYVKKENGNLKITRICHFGDIERI